MQQGKTKTSEKNKLLIVNIIYDLIHFKQINMACRIHLFMKKKMPQVELVYKNQQHKNFDANQRVIFP
jgi:hypothetical protein